MDRTDALVEVVYEVTRKTEGRLSAGARKSLREIYDLTLENFAKEGERQKVYVWDNKRYRAFVLREVRKIATAARKKAGTGKQISATMLHEAAVEVMGKAQKTCDTAIVGGKLRLAHPQIRKQGKICSSYLATQM